MMSPLQENRKRESFPTEELLTLEMAAAYCGVSRTTIAKKIKEKRLKATRPFKMWRIKKADLDEYLIRETF